MERRKMFDDDDGKDISTIFSMNRRIQAARTAK